MALDSLADALVPIGGPDLVSAVDAVSNSLRRAIVQGKIQPGTRLGHEAVANSLGVSRQPVREALRQLQAEGFVLRSGNRGYVVRESTAGEVEQAYYLRWLLESDAAYFAAMGDHSAQVQRLRLINYGIKNAFDLRQVDEMARLNGEFHRLIRECSEMSLLVQLIDKIWVGITVLTPVFIPERGKKSVREHEAIIQAMQDEDPQSARKAMQDHVAAGASDFYRSRGIRPPDLLKGIIGETR